MGINWTVHFSVVTVAVRNKIGNLLAPKEPWGEWKKDMEGEAEKLETIGGLRSLTMMQTRRTDGYSGSISARVEPSTLQHIALNGIFMEINDHYDLGASEAMASSDAAIDVLESETLRLQLPQSKERR
jgi:hypothetical protein